MEDNVQYLVLIKVDVIQRFRCFRKAVALALHDNKITSRMPLFPLSLFLSICRPFSPSFEPATSVYHVGGSKLVKFIRISLKSIMGGGNRCAREEIGHCQM